MDDQQDSPHFKIGTDEENPDTLLQAEISDQRVDKLSQRVTVIAILIPCIVILIMVFGYFDIKKRFVAIQGSGEKEVKSLSKNIESSYSSLSVQFAKLDKTVQEKITGIEEQAGGLQKDLKNIHNSLKSLYASKSSRKELKILIGKLDKKFAVIEKNINALAAAIKNLDNKINQNFTEINEAVSGSKAETTEVKQQVAALAESMIDRKDLEIALKAEQQSYQQHMADLSTDVKKNVAMARVKIKELEKRLSALEKRPIPAPEPPAPSAPQPTPATAPAQPSKPPAASPDTPSSGEIIEQDIQ